MNVNICEFTFCVCHKHRHTFACTSQLFHNKSISFKDTNSCGYNRQYIEVQQYWWSSKGLTVCTGAYCVHRRLLCAQAPTVTGFTLRREPALQGSNHSCHFTTARSHDLPIKSQEPEYLCGNFYIFKHWLQHF